MKILAAATAFTLLTGVAFAQDAATPPAQTPAPAAGGMPSGPLPPPPGLTQGTAAPETKAATDSIQQSQRRGRPAHFRVDTGKVKLSLRCGDDQSTQQCAETLTRLLDRLQEASSDDRTDSDGRSARLMRDRDTDGDRGNRFRHRDRDWDDEDHDDDSGRGRDRRWRD